jgi:hypothetical protein
VNSGYHQVNGRDSQRVEGDMALPPTSRESMLLAMQQFEQGTRSPQGPKVGVDWLGNGDDGEPYPVKEIIRLAVKIATGVWPSRFWGGPTDANRYVAGYGFTVVPKADWLRAS